LLYVKSTLKPIEFEVSSTFVDHIFCKTGKIVISICYYSSNYSIVGHDNNNKLDV